jgi:hypothetical protein
MVFWGIGLFKLLRTLNVSKLVLLAALTVMLTSCASIAPVAPWEKGFLAKPEMTFEVDVLDQNFTEHTYFSKEGSFGGSGVGGGGCGCN